MARLTNSDLHNEIKLVKKDMTFLKEGQTKMQADITIAEPKALIGFAGQRVIKQTTSQELPDHFQTSEFLKEKGFIDFVVDRKNLKNSISKVLDVLA